MVGLAVVTARDSFGLLLPSPRMRDYSMYNYLRRVALPLGTAASIGAHRSGARGFLPGVIVAPVRASGKSTALDRSG
jgi:hypothetical protein